MAYLIRSAVAVAIFTLVLATPTPNEASIKVVRAPLEGYKVGRGITFMGTIEEGGPEYTFHGTIEEIRAQILKIKPDFVPSAPSEEDQFNSTLAKRGDRASMNCGHVGKGWNGDAESWLARERANYLKGLNGMCGVNNGGGECSRISCAYNTGIWICNDTNGPLSKPCKYLGKQADVIINECEYPRTDPQPAYNEPFTWLVKGQRFDTEGYNIIINGDAC
ncbi:hypothetical protein F5Y04DRAFT_279698 [Hypomontagnella monticulosa]|nr:hypothetical protein F5Y04DRAFT_279698 [Hypomontagnella monticulosa]